MNARKIIGRNIRALRKVKGLTQEELAKLAQFQKSYIGGVERGERNITIDNLEELAKALEIPMHLLLQPEFGPSLDGPINRILYEN